MKYLSKTSNPFFVVGHFGYFGSGGGDFKNILLLSFALFISNSSFSEKEEEDDDDEEKEE